MTSNNFDPTKHIARLIGLDDDGNVTEKLLTAHDIYIETKHDLIPRADVMELVKALECYRPIKGGMGNAASKAITNFKQKYGDINGKTI